MKRAPTVSRRKDSAWRQSRANIENPFVELSLEDADALFSLNVAKLENLERELEGELERMDEFDLDELEDLGKQLADFDMDFDTIVEEEEDEDEDYSPIKQPTQTKAASQTIKPQNTQPQQKIQSHENSTASKPTRRNASISTQKPAETKPLKRNINTFVGCFTDPGERYGPINQDCFLFAPIAKSGYIFGVFDGHGINGEIASKIAKETFEEYFAKNDIFSLPRDKQKEAIKSVFRQAHDNITVVYEDPKINEVPWKGTVFKLIERNGLKIYRGPAREFGVSLLDFGTTGVIAAVKFNSKGEGIEDIIIANTGDSLAIIGRDNGSGFTPIDNLCVVHNTENPDEVNRLKSLKNGLNVSSEENYVSAPQESGFSWARLAVTRSIGHYYFHKYGIIPDPSFAEYKLNSNDRYLVLSSDGLTDILSPEEIIDGIKFFKGQDGNLENVATRLVSQSLSGWDPDEKADNTTAVVVDLTKIFAN